MKKEIERQPNGAGTDLIHVNVPWNTMPMLEAQQWYAKLKQEFERAGAILNARSCSESEEGYVCFMAVKEGACKKGVVHTGRPAGIDSSHKNPKTGLYDPVRICSERCWILYQGQLIQERRARELGQEA